MHVIIKTNFVTNPEGWLGQSLYLNNLFSRKWGNKQEDNSYFIKTNANLFKYHFRHLCTSVFPVFYNGPAGYDFPLY